MVDNWIKLTKLLFVYLIFIFHYISYSFYRLTDKLVALCSFKQFLQTFWYWLVLGSNEKTVGRGIAIPTRTQWTSQCSSCCVFFAFVVFLSPLFYKGIDMSISIARQNLNQRHWPLSSPPIKSIFSSCCMYTSKQSSVRRDSHCGCAVQCIDVNIPLSLLIQCVRFVDRMEIL